MKRVAFAVPGDLQRLTGGTIYDRRVIDELREIGLEVLHIELPASFPDPSADEMREALAQLADVPADVPVIVDGLALGALDPEGVVELCAPVIALVHHPLAEESGLDEARRAYFQETERANLSHVQSVVVTSPHTAQL
ncbi:MAG: glycosyltransferase family 1 protein, partial [Pseudomonadota bacterium]